MDFNEELVKTVKNMMEFVDLAKTINFHQDLAKRMDFDGS